MVVNGLRVALLLVLGFATPLLAADTLISAARLLDVRSGKLLDRPVLLVRDGRIVEIARDGARPAGFDLHHTTIEDVLDRRAGWMPSVRATNSRRSPTVAI